VTEHEVVEFYWRPGCGFCSRLERALIQKNVAIRKHNIWDDPAHAAVVRSFANGNETVPTVVIGQIGLVNPSPDAVVAAIAARAG
jgi:mycoredoxin